jgi:Cd2+/Zn2+-exporting ATPase
VNGRYQGCIVIDDTLKPGAEVAVRQLRERGMEAVMLTGDGEITARAVANKVGIREIHAGLLPQQKLEHLQSIRKEKGAAMFVGDGINDAPVLAGADVGAAMGSGADAAIEAADVVFMTSDVEAVPRALAIAAETNKIAWQNVVFALAVKLVVMILGLLGHASMWLAVFADSGVAMLCVLNSIRLLYKK